MPERAVRAASCTPSSNSRWERIPQWPVPAPPEHFTRSCSIRWTESWQGCWSSRNRASSSAKTGSSTSLTWSPSRPDADPTPMKIESAELYELTLPLKEPFTISGGVMRERRSLIVALHDDAGNVGYGESPPFELPFYSGETLASA